MENKENIVKIIKPIKIEIQIDNDQPDKCNKCSWLKRDIITYPNMLLPGIKSRDEFRYWCKFYDETIYEYYCQASSNVGGFEKTLAENELHLKRCKKCIEIFGLGEKE